MIPEKMLELLILGDIFKQYDEDTMYKKFIDTNYDIDKLDNRYFELGKEFLTPYALDKTEKSD
jgi:hypothetical protein